jgi:hypothetical protein
MSFKAYLARWIAQTTVLAPFTFPMILPWLQASATAAAASCPGRTDVTCMTKWYVGGWDGAWGVGQQLSALEVVQALLVADTRHLSIVSETRYAQIYCTVVPLIVLKFMEGWRASSKA